MVKREARRGMSCVDLKRERRRRERKKKEEVLKNVMLDRC